MNPDGGVDAVEEEGQGAGNEGQEDKTVVVNGVGGDCQCCSEHYEQVVKDINPQQRDHVSNHTCGDERDEPAALKIRKQKERSCQY